LQQEQQKLDSQRTQLTKIRTQLLTQQQQSNLYNAYPAQQSPIKPMARSVLETIDAP